jgi:hypothetical protein
VRTKRGLVDTGRAGGYCKDQVSFAGLMQLLQNRERVSFELLHSCKLPWQCVASNPNLQKAREFGHPMLVPAFIMEGEAAYRRRLDDLVQVPSAAAVQQAPRPITRCSGQRSRPLPRLAHLIGARAVRCAGSGRQRASQHTEAAANCVLFTQQLPKCQ